MTVDALCIDMGTHGEYRVKREGPKSEMWGISTFKMRAEEKASLKCPESI